MPTRLYFDVRLLRRKNKILKKALKHNIVKVSSQMFQKRVQDFRKGFTQCIGNKHIISEYFFKTV